MLRYSLRPPSVLWALPAESPLDLQKGAAGYLVALGGLAGLAVRLAAGVAADRRRFDALRGVATLCLLGALGWSAMATGSAVAFSMGW